MPLPLGLSYRRALLDAELERLAGALGGLVVDVGAKRAPRGSFAPALGRVRRWLRVNIDPAERPDVVADAAALPLRGACADWVVCVEVLQYVTLPDAAMRDAARVLAPAGAVVLAVPFLHRADGPTDRHRFTETRVRELLELVSRTVEANPGATAPTIRTRAHVTAVVTGGRCSHAAGRGSARTRPQRPSRRATRQRRRRTKPTAGSARNSESASRNAL